MTTWTNIGHVAESLLAQETSIFDLILQEDGYPIVVDYGTLWDELTKNTTSWASATKN
jgi:hypothetical protein